MVQGLESILKWNCIRLRLNETNIWWNKSDLSSRNKIWIDGIFFPICHLFGLIIGNATTRMHTIFDGKDKYTATHSLLSVIYFSIRKSFAFCSVLHGLIFSFISRYAIKDYYVSKTLFPVIFCEICFCFIDEFMLEKQKFI